MVTFHPLYDRILVKRLVPDEKSDSLIIIPESVKEKPSEGNVIAVGFGKLHNNGTLSPLAIQVGARVLFGKYSGSLIQVNGEELIVMREEDIFGVINVEETR